MAKILHFKKAQLSDEYYIQQAVDYYGAAIRDNTREQKIAIGKEIEEGTLKEYDEDDV